MFRIVHLTKDHYSTRAQIGLGANKGKLVTYEYYTIDGRKFSKKSGSNEFGKVVFDENIQHSE
jgi:hypothetical protein